MSDETFSGRHSTLNNTSEAGSFRDDFLRDGNPQTTRKLQLLSVGPLVLGVFEDEIATIAEWRRPTPLPQAPPAVLGVVSIQGRMLTVLDPVSLFGETTSRLGFPPGLLVALRGDEQIGLAVKTKGDTLDLALQDIQPPSDPANRALGGTIQYRELLVNVIQVGGLFPAALRGRERRRRRF
ncbi:MAG: chemotaxis protein CheW [Pyrinomonadaceae bacterium]|nr:chemotaxis protein CheW [Pyrinomonadaceae bacterium]